MTFASVPLVVVLRLCKCGRFLYSVPGSAQSRSHCITTGGKGGGVALPPFKRLRNPRHIQEMKPISLADSHVLNLSWLWLFVISPRVILIWKTLICRW